MINQRDSNRRRNAVTDENEKSDQNKKKETLQLKRRNMHRRNRFKNICNSQGSTDRIGTKFLTFACSGPGPTDFGNS